MRLGFVPLTDCAPLIIAFELGLFRKYGLRVTLSRELGWATIRDKVIYGELDAAHAIAGMPVAATLGLGSVRCDCLTALVLNLHGNAITLSDELWRRGARDGVTLREEIVRSRARRTLTFGVVYPFSSHNYLLRKWLAASGIQPDRDVHIVVVPPPQMITNLKAHHLDGFCVGEPWNSLAVQSKVGRIVATSAALAPGHPEKVLMVRRDFAEQCESEHIALVAALIEACEYCESPRNLDEVVSILAHPEYVNVSPAVLRDGISEFCVFHRDDANEPSGDKVAWILQNIRTSGLCKDPSALDFQLGRRVFRGDIFEQAAKLRSAQKSSRNSSYVESRLAPV